MLTIEHEYDYTVVTLLDNTGVYEDLEVEFDEHGLVFRQWNEQLETFDLIQITTDQFRELLTALDLPEGAYE
jgi:hypothetical protein